MQLQNILFPLATKKPCASLLAKRTVNRERSNGKLRKLQEPFGVEPHGLDLEATEIERQAMRPDAQGGMHLVLGVVVKTEEKRILAVCFFA